MCLRLHVGYVSSETVATGSRVPGLADLGAAREYGCIRGRLQCLRTAPHDWLDAQKSTFFGVFGFDP